ncbi:MAG: hypothetical protein CBB92_03050 [Flammeovirgaceae bacterium TMED32]|nr:MAG: hypothetical protein CBB92_03050 [Flammeovirgaceae bacterium TMED32]
MKPIFDISWSSFLVFPKVFGFSSLLHAINENGRTRNNNETRDLILISPSMSADIFNFLKSQD